MQSLGTKVPILPLQNYIYAASFQMAVETTTPDEYLSLKMISNAKN
jgi:hypothetical protein